MDFFTFLFTQMDKILMPFYRLTDNHLLGYFAGTFLLALICVVTGKYSTSFAFRMAKENIIHDSNEAVRYESLSIEALRAGNKAAYKACNSTANDAFGKFFFLRIALSASSIWPVFIALGWMQYRFSEVKFILPFSVPGAGNTVGYLATFFLCYISARILFGKIRSVLSLTSDPA